MKLAVFLPNWVGDAVMATPALRALRRMDPSASMVGVMRPHIADVLQGTGWLDEIICYAPRSTKKEHRSLSVLRALRNYRPDSAVLMPNTPRSALLAQLAGAKQRIGYARYGRGPLLTHRLKPPRIDGRDVPHAMVDYYLQLAYTAGCPEESPRLELATTPVDEKMADLVWCSKRLSPGSPVVTLNCSGAFGASKLWPPPYFAELARHIASDFDHDVLVLCGPQERDVAREIVAKADHPKVTSLADAPLSLGLSKACVKRSRLMVSTDSGPRHFAVAFGVPIVGLFGPTPPIWGENPTARETRLSTDLDCLGCHKRTCPLGHHRCMRDLSVDTVFAAVQQMLTDDRTAKAA